MNINVKKEAKAFANQTFDFLKEEVLTGKFKGDLYVHFDRYGLKEVVEDFVLNERVARSDKTECYSKLLLEVKREYLLRLQEVLIEQLEENILSKSDIDYLVQRKYLEDGSYEEDPDGFSDEEIKEDIEEHQQKIEERTLIINDLQYMINTIKGSGI